MVDCVSQVQLSKTLALLLSWHCVRSAAYKSKQDCPQNEQAISLALCTIHSGSEFDRQCCVTITQHEPGGSTVVCQTASGEWQQALLDNLKVAADASNQQIMFEACVRNDHEWLVKQSTHHGIGYMTELASQTNACEETPLHICAAHSSLDCIHVLLKLGAVTRSAINLVDQGVYSSDLSLRDGFFFRPPGYSLFWAPFYWAFGEGRAYIAVAAVQTLLDTATIGLVWTVILRLGGSTTAALVGAVVYSLYPFTIVWITPSLPDAVSNFAVFGLLTMLLTAERHPW